MKEWWNWSPQQGTPQLGFAVVGVGRFGSAVCRELMQNGADVLAVDRSERSIEELRQLEPSIEARVVDCTDEESMREAGVLEMGTVVVGISEPIEASITTTLIAKDSEGSKVQQVIARATSDLGECPARRAVAHLDRGQREAAARVEMAHDATLLVEAHALAHGHQVRLGQVEV